MTQSPRSINEERWCSAPSMLPAAAVIPVKDVVVVSPRASFYCRRASDGLAEPRSPPPHKDDTVAAGNRRCARWSAAEASISVFLIRFKCGCGLDCHRCSSTAPPPPPWLCGKPSWRTVDSYEPQTKRGKSKYGPDSLHVYTSSLSCGVP